MDEHINKNLSERALEDYENVKKAIEGDQKAYTFLMKRYQNAIYHMMFRMIGRKEDADDLTQEAFSKAFNKLSSYAPRYAFSTWLFKIASNNCIDHIRKKRLVLLSIDETIENEGGQTFSNNLKSTNLDPEQKFIQQQRIKLMRTLMRQLSEKYRLMIELRFFEELSYEEISRELDIPLGTVKAQLFRAKEILYSLMQTPVAKAHVDWKRKKKS
ncbi:MAG: RNA polymerase sigma factor (sigma-70 family) [Cognaticolwellia sp.]|jgi:RNA polymerase sigma-70 factor (ECF subfamily)|tara:strand:+ start:1327 stop:1968 length:642 start_codon:yes stop_codon:yes gene_type:complete